MYEWIRDFEEMRTFFCGPDIVPVKIGHRELKNFLVLYG